MIVPDFDPPFQDNFRALLRWRRDIRHFRTDPISESVMTQLFADAAMAPSVGLSEPWRFVRVDDPARRAAVREIFLRENTQALAEQGERVAQYAKLKLEGIDRAPVQIAVFADPDPDQGHGLGRRTMPETLAYSAVMAIHTLWLSARAHGIGLGWVSILDPVEVRQVMDVPEEWNFVGYLCLGYPVKDDPVPELEREGWEHRRPMAEKILRR
ncbi:5,6-dimethylbenzimidazole synthase [Oleisolibacter albus]|uniref:5,6-dimethylbenzimidazole synthase n=1 Tax=Oleisolibacter albus TaxID=2171757 RepID=UPI000DF47559|nr:5,6-dimethylbenzimidazole synthase [Oleisolibacter albus]